MVFPFHSCEKRITKDIGSKDGSTNLVSFRPSLGSSNSIPIRSVSEETEGAVEGELELDVYKEWRDADVSEVGPPATTFTGAESIIKVDAVLLLLIGVPGSGKSTFCNKLMSNAAQPWTRICQDIITKGKKGSKKDCLKHSEHALALKHSVVIDRCNIDKAQRVEFLHLAARFDVEAHAVVLNLPASVCIQRAAKRVGHEGGVYGANAEPIINRFSRTRQLPSLSEGFSRIAFCRTEIDVERVVQQYRELVPGRPLELGVFGASVNKGKSALQLVLGKGSSLEIDGDVIGNSFPQIEENKRKAQEAHEVVRGKSDQMQYSWSSGQSVASDVRNLSCGTSMNGEGSSTLAFPSISTSDFQFDHERASSVLVEVLSEFLLKTENLKLRLLLVDLTDSHMLSLVRRKAIEKGFDPLRFFTFVGDITKLRSRGGPGCSIIANAANWRLKGGGGGVNAAIYKAAGPDLENATKKVAQILNPGTSVVVQLPQSSPLYRQEGVTHVIHVLGPNMNVQRPNCLSGDYSEGCKILHNAYTSLFRNFASTVQVHSVSEPTPETILDIGSINQKPKRNAFTVLMQASKRNREVVGSNPKRDKGRVIEEVVAQRHRGTEGTTCSGIQDLAQSSGLENLKLETQLSSKLPGMATGRSTRAVAAQEETDMEKQNGAYRAQGGHQGGINSRKKWDSWVLALYRTAMHPEEYKDIVLQVTDDAIVLRDMYPKAKKHLLVVARRTGLDSLDDVQIEHLPVLQHMHSLGQERAVSFLMEDPSLSFRIGYHSVPSMRQVHLHVISQDFDSTSLKNKKHWNSFTTPFFRDSLDVLAQLEGHGRVQICVKDAETLLDVELRCHRCRSAHPNLPRLKQHISSCRQPFANASHLITLESLTV